MKLITEYVENVEVLTENTSSGKVLYLHGPMLQSNIKNRNGRIYPKPIMEKAVDKYIKEYVNERRAIGELNHPNRPFADPKEAALMVENLNWDGDHVVGKARVLNTPSGQIIKALMEANFKMGVSSRGLGDIREQNGTKYVNNYLLNAIDAVDMPSGQSCYVEALNESIEWVEVNGVWTQKQSIQEKTEHKQFDEKAFMNSLDKYIETLKKGRK